jgi:hypothetical protein
MVIEMLFIYVIHFIFVPIIVHFQINVIMYIIEFFLKVNSNHFIWTKSS